MLPIVRTTHALEPGRYVPVGDPELRLLMPREATVRVERDSGPTVELTLRVEDRRPYVAAVKVEVGADGVPVTVPDLAEVEVNELADQVIARWLSVEAPTVYDEDGTPGMGLDEFEDGPDRDRIVHALEQRRRRRNEVTPARLRKVAIAYGDGGRRGIDAVRAGLHVSQAQAYRLVAKARAAGLIQPKEDQ
jgi:hypothetical protein